MAGAFGKLADSTGSHFPYEENLFANYEYAEQENDKMVPSNLSVESYRQHGEAEFSFSMLL